MPVLDGIFHLYDRVNHEMFYAIDIAGFMLLLALLVRLLRPQSRLRYQWTLIFLGLPMTLWLWAHYWENFLLLYTAWWLLVAVVICFCTARAAVIVLTVVYFAYTVYARAQIASPWWSPMLYILTLQMQYMRAVDVALAWPDIDASQNTRLLALLSYIATPLNVTSNFYGRFADWSRHLDNPDRIPALALRKVLLAKRFTRVVLCLGLIAAQEPIITFIARHTTTSGVAVALFNSAVWIRLTYWPLWNNLYFLGADTLGTPGVEVSDSPILATSPIDYWRRTQLGVATFFKEKVYYAKWFGRRSPYINAFLTFTFLGIWHGFCYPWVLWGVAWGLLIAANHYLETRFGPAIKRASKPVRWIVRLAGWAFTVLVVHELRLVAERDSRLPRFLTLYGILP